MCGKDSCLVLKDMYTDLSLSLCRHIHIISITHNDYQFASARILLYFAIESPITFNVFGKIFRHQARVALTSSFSSCYVFKYLERNVL